MPTASASPVLRTILLVLAVVASTLVGPPAQAATGTTLTLANSIEAPLAYGGDGQVKARLRTAAGKKLGNRAVTLWGRPVGAATWEKVGSTRTMSSGLAIFTLPDMTRSTELEARFKKTGGYAASRSAPIVQQVQAPLSPVTTTPAQVFSGDTVTARATTAAELAGTDVLVERYQGVEWTEVGRGTVGPGGAVEVRFPAGTPSYDPQDDTYRPQYLRVLTTDGVLAPGERDFSITTRPWGLGGHTINGNVGEQTSYQIEAQGGTGPFVFTVIGGSLAPGMSLSRSGLYSGSPTVKGSHRATVRVTDAAGRTATGDLVLNVSGDGIEILTSRFPDAVVGRYYETAVEVRGAVGDPDFEIEGLPDGLYYYPDGTVFGSPEQTGDFSVRVHVFDEDFNYAMRDITLRVSGG